MYKRALRTILKKNKDSFALIQDLCSKLQVEVTVLHENRYLLGSEKFPYKFALKEDNQRYGTLYGTTKNGCLIAELIQVLVKKEVEKKKIGQEVLGLYREINMIYDFSEKISENIELESIADIALKEASKMIDSTHGLFLMYNEDDGSVLELSSFGQHPRKENNIKEYHDLLEDLILKGTSSIPSSRTLEKFEHLQHLKSLMYCPLKVKNRPLGLLMLGHQEEKEFTAAELKLLTTIALQSASALESAQLYQKGLQEAQSREEAIRKIHDVSLKFVPFEFLKSLGKTKLTEVSLGDQVEKKVTVLFADIREFTSISEKLNPKENFLFVNNFNKKMGPIIRNHHGFIMQYLGDGFMAIFPGSPKDALRASIEMHHMLNNGNFIEGIDGHDHLKIGIGMHIGKLIMGVTGDVDRLDAALISDTVNTASRIEGLSKYFGTSILLTENCLNNLEDNDDFDFRYLGLVQVKGKRKPIKIYECINGDAEDLYTHKVNTLSEFNKGMEHYFNREFAIAAVTFQQILKKNALDKTADLFLNRSAHLITQDVEEDWMGVVSVHLK